MRTIDITLRPIKLAFLVAYYDKEASLGCSEDKRIFYRAVNL